jgi:hypothetical protein
MAVAAGGADPSASFAPGVEPRVAAGGHRLPIGVSGSVLVVGGAVLQLVALVGSPWFSAIGTGGDQVRLGFGDFAPLTQRGLAFMYFTWGAWVIFLLSLGLGVAACVRWRGAGYFRVFGALVGVAGAFTTVAAVLVFAYQTSDDAFHVASNYGVGIYLAVLGLLASALGSAASVVSI